MAKAEKAQCFTPAFPYQRHFDGYVEMSEEEDALFWEVDVDRNPASWRESTDPAPYPVKATLAEGLCQGTAGLPAPETTRSVQAVNCSTAQAASTETVQDTKPEMQPHAASPPDIIEAKETDTGIQRPSQAMLGSQTENESEPSKPETTEATTETTPAQPQRW